MKKTFSLLLLAALSTLCPPKLEAVAMTAQLEATSASGASNLEGSDRYGEIARYIARRVLALRGRSRGFNSIRWSKHVHIDESPFKPVVVYNNGVTRWEPVLDAEPPMNRAVYSKRGFTVVIWMVKGELSWQPRRQPVKVGVYTIDAQVVGPQQARIRPLVDKIVRETAEHFNP